MRTTVTTISTVLAMFVLCTGIALAAPSAGQKCEAGKNGAAGKYTACLHKAQQKFVNGGEVDTERRDADMLACGMKYSDKWRSLETKAGTGICPSEGDESTIQDFLEACIFSAEDALGGSPLPPDVVTCNVDLGTCVGNLGTCSTDLTSTNADLGECSGTLGTCNAGTAVSGDVLAGETFSSAAGLGATGTMPNNGGMTLTPGVSDQAIVAGYHDGTGQCAGDADLSATNIKNGVDLFGVTGLLSAGSLTRTGQTTCYDSTGAPTSCAGTGHDGELQKGLARTFTDNGDGTLTDNLTGLMWEKLSDDSSIHDKDASYTWDQAFASKAALLNSAGFAGHGDWRVPNQFELFSLVNLGELDPATYPALHDGCVDGCDVTTCNCTQSGYYWSSSTYEGGTSGAWFVGFVGGYTGAGGKTNAYYVRAVRGGL